MSTLIVAGILIASILLISIAFIINHKNGEQKKRASILAQFDGELSQRGLAFSKRLLLRNRILAIDALNGSLLVLEVVPTKKFISIPLDHINHCVTTKNYENINMGSGKREVIERHLRSIGLELHLKTSADPVFIPFFESNSDGMFQIAELEAEAKNWEMFLVKTVSERVVRA